MLQGAQDLWELKRVRRGGNALSFKLLAIGCSFQRNTKLNGSVHALRYGHHSSSINAHRIPCINPGGIRLELCCLQIGQMSAWWARTQDSRQVVVFGHLNGKTLEHPSFFFFLFFPMLGTKPRAFHTLSKLPRSCIVTPGFMVTWSDTAQWWSAWLVCERPWVQSTRKPKMGYNWSCPLIVFDEPSILQELEIQWSFKKEILQIPSTQDTEARGWPWVWGYPGRNL